jgi:micrococcal nuclease
VWRRLIVLVLLVSAGCGTEGPVVDVAGDRAEVVGISDGDTIRVELADGTRERVRLVGISAPERDVCGFAGATEHLRRALEGERVQLIPDSSQPRRDRFGRLLAYVERTDGLDAGGEQVLRGWAHARRYGGRGFDREGVYGVLEDQAREDDRQVWGRCPGGFADD